MLYICASTEPTSLSVSIWTTDLLDVKPNYMYCIRPRARLVRSLCILNDEVFLSRRKQPATKVPQWVVFSLVARAEAASSVGMVYRLRCYRYAYQIKVAWQEKGFETVLLHARLHPIPWVVFLVYTYLCVRNYIIIYVILETETDSPAILEWWFISVACCISRN